VSLHTLTVPHADDILRALARQGATSAAAATRLGGFVAPLSESLVRAYLEHTPAGAVHPGALAFWASLDHIHATSPVAVSAIVRELVDQRANVKLIASENYCSLAVQLAQGNLFTDKYAEGYPQHRFYAGCDNVDDIEIEAANLAKALFGADHAYVQPHSGADANLVAFLAILATRVETPVLERLGQTDPVKVSDADWAKVRAELNGQRLLALDYFSGGHLTHGYRRNFSSRLFETHTYTVDRTSNLLDYGALRARVREVRPLILLGGYSAYSRKIDFAKMRELADEVGAVLMVDMAHFSGLVAGKVFTGDFNPVPFAHVLTTTTHKTLRGPRGGMVLCTKEFASAVDKGCPSILGGPLPHVMAAKAVAFREALAPAFQQYAARIVENARALAEALTRRGVHVLTGGTDNHLLLVDVARTFGLTGRQAESALRACGLTMNRNSLPFDANGPWYTSGLRLGTPATTTLGMGAPEMEEIAELVSSILRATRPSVAPAADGSPAPSKAKFDLADSVLADSRRRVHALMRAYAVYPELDIDIARQTAWGLEAVQPAAT
jgi:glycine hydroxymethyltransferase